MRERYGKNSFQERKTDTTIQRLRRAFINPFHVILFILGIVSLVTDVFMASNFTRNATTALIIFHDRNQRYHPFNSGAAGEKHRCTA